MISPQLTVQCHNKTEAPYYFEMMERGSATTDHQFAYFTSYDSNSVYVLVKVPAEYITGYNVRGMCREANKARGGAECFISLETHSEYVISGNVRGYTGTLTGLLYEYGAFQTTLS